MRRRDLDPTDEGWLYLASVIDLASRQLLGWSMGAHHDAQLVCDAVGAAVATRGLARLDGTIFHTDAAPSTPPAPARTPASGWGCASR